MPGEPIVTAVPRCPLKLRFIGFLGAAVFRQCIKLQQHEGNHVVYEPTENKPLEVLTEVMEK
jgi:hypothetical protein